MVTRKDIENLKVYCKMKKKYYANRISKLLEDLTFWQNDDERVAYLSAISEEDDKRITRTNNPAVLEGILNKMRGQMTLEEAKANLRDRIDEIKKEIEYYSEQQSSVSEIISHFHIDGGTEGFKNLVDTLINLKLFCLDYRNDVSLFASLIGKAIYATAEEMKKKNSNESEQLLIQLAKAFNENGEYNGNLSPEEFISLFDLLFKNVWDDPETFVLNVDLQEVVTDKKEVIEEFDLVEYLSNEYSKILKRNSQKETTPLPESSVTENTSKKVIDYTAIKEARRFYVDGEIITTCEDVEYLEDIFKRAGYRHAEIKSILKKMKAKIKESVLEEETVDSRIFTESDLEIYHIFLKELETRTIFDEEYFTIKHYITELKALYELSKLPDALEISDEDAIDLKNEVAENTWPLIAILGANDNNHNKYNLYYLLNEKGVGTILEDIELLGKQCSALIPKLMSKLNNGNTSSAGTLRYKNSFNVNYLTHGQLVAYYVELIPGKYLVLGISKTVGGVAEEFGSRFGKDLESKIAEVKSIVSEKIVDKNIENANLSINELIFEHLSERGINLKLD